MHLLPVLVSAALAASPGDGVARLLARPEGDGIRVHVSKRGLFSGFAHDHAFEVTRWRGHAELPGGDPSRVSLELVLDATSLREREHALSAGDREKVERQAAGRDVLDAERHPEITFRATRATLEPRSGEAAPIKGVLHGMLSLRDRTGPVDVPFEAEPAGEGWRVRGKARFRQSAWGIEPFSGFGGAVGVKDEVELAFAIRLDPAR